LARVVKGKKTRNTGTVMKCKVCWKLWRVLHIGIGVASRFMIFYKYSFGEEQRNLGRVETSVPKPARLSVLQEAVSKPSDRAFECYQ
jgi:hypothetical protein